MSGAQSSSPRPAAIFLHGAGAGGWEWAIWREVFSAQGIDCRCPDLRPSSQGLQHTGFDDYLSQVGEWADALSAPVIMVGASLGGLLALKWADALGDGAVRRIAALVLLNPHPGYPEAEQMPPMRGGESGLICWGRDSRLAAPKAGATSIDDASRLRSFRGWKDESARVLQEARTQKIIRRISARSLWIASNDDTDVPPALTLAMADRLGGDVMRITGDHLSPLIGRQAAGLAQQVLAWLSTS